MAIDPVKVGRLGPNLDVADKNGKIEVFPEPDGNGQTLTWELSDGAALLGARFSEDARAPAFIWVKQPPAGIFGNWAVTYNGRRLTLDVNHTGPDTVGEWKYMLLVLARDKQTLYRTRHDGTLKGGKTVSNPVIVNKIEDPKQSAVKKADKKATKKATKKAAKKPRAR
jgi:hypothetical protein